MRLVQILCGFLLSASLSLALVFDRVPEGGIQPQIAVAPDGSVHLIYFKGDPMGGDIFYAWRKANSTNFFPPLKVNHRDGSAIAAGTMRGPQFALGKGNRVHVAWMGGNGAEKVEVQGQRVTPMLYTRLNNAGTAFEPERNLITHAAGLDGGGTVAANGEGDVWVIWHGAPPDVEGEENRAVYVAHSSTEGVSFAREWKANLGFTGSCACCGIKALAADSRLHLLYRGVDQHVNRPLRWLISEDGGKSFRLKLQDEWKIATCPASSATMISAENRILGAWETEGKITAAVLEGSSSDLQTWTSPAGGKQKYPGIASNDKGEVMLVWVEAGGWGKGGKLAWQSFKNGKPHGEKQSRDGVPAWSFGAVYANGAGEFRVIY